MLKEMFEAHFYSTFPRKDEVVLMIDEWARKGHFALVDTKACRGCRFVCSDDSIVREQLKVYGENYVYVVSMDQIFSYVNENVGEISDYLLESANSVTLVEMTCSTTDYVRGKRQKARGQLYNTLSLLFASSVVRNHIEKKKVRYVVFSWKETYPNVAEIGSAENSMKGMMLMADEVYSPYNESKFDFGFKLREIRYPDVLVCE